MLTKANEEYFDLRSTRKLIAILAVILFIVQALGILLFVFGPITFNGDEVTPLAAVTMVLELFSIPKGQAYMYLMNVVIGVTYTISIVILLKNFFPSVSTYFKLFKQNQGTMKDKHSDLDYIIGVFEANFLVLALCIFIPSMLLEYEITTLGSIILICCSISYLIVEFVRSKLNNYTMGSCLHRVCCVAIMALSLILIYIYAAMPSFENFIDGFKILFNGLMSSASGSELIIKVYKYIISPLLYFAFQITIIRFGMHLFGGMFYLENEDARFSAKVLMGFMIVLAALEIAIYSLSGHGSNGMTEYLTAIKSVLPLLLAAISLFVSFSFENNKTINYLVKAEVERAESEEMDAEEDE